MKARVKKYKLLFIASVVCFCIVSVFFSIEKVKTSNLQKQLNALDNIVAPYYEKSVFETPGGLAKNAGEKGIKIPIIMYHYVEYVKDAGDLIRKRLDVTPALFEDQLKALKKAHYETYYVKDVSDILDGTIHYSTQSAILSFDDGYQDFYTDVFPLLKKYHMRATLYVIYNYIGKKGFLTDQQIREIVDSDLVEIGSHTLDHIYLKIAPKEYADKQIVESKKKFEERFGIKVKTFAYPYGAFNNDNIETVKKAGYTGAVSVMSGEIQSKNNLFYLSRIRPGLFTPDSMIHVIEQMNK